LVSPLLHISFSEDLFFFHKNDFNPVFGFYF